MKVVGWFRIFILSFNLYDLAMTLFCGKTFNRVGSGGILVRSDVGKTCDYRINIPSSSGMSWLRLRFSEFKMDGDMPECNKDRIEILTGCIQVYKIATFCGNNMISSRPHDIYTKDKCITVRQMVQNENKNSTSAGSQSYFSLYYYSGTGSAGLSSSCRSKSDLRSDTGIISSPNWPDEFNRNHLPFPSRDCEWDIETSSKNLIQINAMDVDFSGGGGYCSYKNYLKIKGKKSVVKKTSLSSSYCSRRHPFTLNTKFYEVDVELKGYYSPSSQEHGFVLGYVVYKDDEATAANATAAIVGTVVVVIFGSIFAFCIFRRWRARRSRQSSQSNMVTSYGSSGSNVTPAPASIPLTNKGGYPQQPMAADPLQGYQGAPPPQGYPGAPPSQAYPGAPPLQGYPGAPPPQGYPGAPPPQGYPSAPPPQGYPDAPPPYAPPSAGAYPPMAQLNPAGAPAPYAPAPYPPQN